jgi:hypothetical protein
MIDLQLVIVNGFQVDKTFATISPDQFGFNLFG